MLTALIGVVVALAAIPASVGADVSQACPADAQYIGSIAAGEHVFWMGAYADTETGEGDCVYEYELDLGPGGDRLRTAIDLVLAYRRSGDKDGVVHPSASADDGRRFGIGFVDPQGNPVELGRDCCDGPQSLSDYSREVVLCFDRAEGSLCEPFSFEEKTPCDLDAETAELRFTCENPNAAAVPEASGGRWKVRVDPEKSTGWQFRMRAGLEKRPTLSDPNRVLLPNMRAVPPFELTFCEPEVSLGFFVAHTPRCGAASNGLTPDEEADLVAAEGPGVKRGLRFSAGPENAALGLFEVRRCEETLLAEDAKDVTVAACQRRYRSSGEAVTPDRPAGTLTFHSGHAHWHYQFFRYELFRVMAGASPKKLSAVDIGRKVGFCPGFERLADWKRFFQEIVLFPVASCFSPTEPRMRLEAGWGDVYEWPRIEQFVQFPTNLDGSPQQGRYVLRTTVDAIENQVEETDETDNTSFVSFKVCQECGPEGVTITKSGYGLGP